MNTSLLTPVLFLDTCTLHTALQYLQFIQENGLKPCDENIEEKITETFPKESGMLGTCRKGRQIVCYLNDKCKSGARVEYPAAVHLEMACGLLRGHACLDAAKEGVPYRMWNRLQEKEVRSRLTMEAYDKVENYRSRFEELFKLADVSISDSDPARTRDIWLIACEIIGSIYLDFGDCIVYADAILAQADEFLTLDSYFRKTVCYINNPGASPAAQKDLFWRAHDRVKSSVANLIGSDIGNVILPIGQET